MGSELLLRCSGRSCLQVAGLPWAAFRGLENGSLTTLLNVLRRGGWSLRPVTVTSDPILIIGGDGVGKSIAVLCPECSRSVQRSGGLLNI